MRWSRRPPVRATNRAAFGLVLSTCLFVLSPPANAAAGGHLYLQVGASIERFPLQRGIPSTQADLTIPHAGGAIAVAGDGTVYALHIRPNDNFDGYVVDAFPPGQTTPARKIVFPHNGMCTLSSPPIQGLAVDGAGNLFVLVVYAQSGARAYRGPTPADVFPICLGVAVFAPTANGNAKPLEALALNDFYFGAMTVSAHDDLYVNLVDDSETFDYANAVRNPHQTRVFPVRDNPAAATDTHGNVYLLNYDSGAFVNVFAPSWISGPPTRSISLAAPFNTSIGLALRGQFAYLATLSGSNGAIGVFDASGDGSESPLAVLNYTGFMGPMAVGP